MRYDALILGFLKPLMLVLTALVAWPLRADAMGLAIAMLVGTAVLPVAAWWAASRHFSLARILRAAVSSRPDRALWGFALPQSANMSLVYLGTGVDVMLLGHFGATTERIAFYATATRVIRNVRQVKLGFSGAFNPVAARLYAERNLAELATQATTVARWSALVGHPILLLVLAFHVELMGLFDPAWAVPSAFLVLLAAPPWLSNAFGLAGNVLVMAGFSRWNLFNTVLFVGSLLVAGFLLIEPYGVWGAAMAACIASIVSPAAQLVQLSRVVGAPFQWRRLLAPNLGFFVGLGCGGALWWGAVAHDGWILHVGVAVVSLAGFALTMLALGIRPEDRALLGRLGKRRTTTPQG
jgi:O-antigen/teichoic acid export membrane protein